MELRFSFFLISANYLIRVELLKKETEMKNREKQQQNVLVMKQREKE